MNVKVHVHVHVYTTPCVSVLGLNIVLLHVIADSYNNNSFDRVCVYTLYLSNWCSLYQYQLCTVHVHVIFVHVHVHVIFVHVHVHVITH